MGVSPIKPATITLEDRVNYFILGSFYGIAKAKLIGKNNIFFSTKRKIYLEGQCPDDEILFVKVYLYTRFKTKFQLTAIFLSQKSVKINGCLFANLSGSHYGLIRNGSFFDL